MKEILESKELGAIKNISATLALPGGFIKDDNIRFDYTLGGGAMMDLGCKLCSLSPPKDEIDISKLKVIR